ncbi:MAG: nitroreductase family protein [Clostridia bacterium]|nr:nitroreductase family protein [Clostridia bacterium]
MENNQVLQAIYERRSVRKYTAEPVSQQQIETVINAALWAPSASNRQPWHLTVFTDPAMIADIEKDGKAYMAQSDNERTAARGKDPAVRIFHNAPCVVLFSHNGTSWAKPDCSIAAQNLALAAHSIGLGTCYIGLFTHWLEDNTEALAARFNLPEGYAPFYFMTLGHPNGVGPAPKRAENTVQYL